MGRNGVLDGVMWFPLSRPTARGATLGNIGIGCALPKVQAEEISDEAKVAKERVDRADWPRGASSVSRLTGESRVGLSSFSRRKEVLRLAFAASMSMSGGLGLVDSDLVPASNRILVGLGLSGFGISTVSGFFSFSRLEVVVAGVGGGALNAGTFNAGGGAMTVEGSLSGGILGTVEALLEVVPDWPVEDARELRVLVEVVEKKETGSWRSKESMRPFEDLISTGAMGGGTLMADIVCIAWGGKSGGSEKLFPESCLALARGSSSDC